MNAAAAHHSDIAALAKGGRTNFFGFVLRLVARIPFLFIAGRLYGAEELGRFASAVVIVELCAQLATLGQKRGLAQQLSRDPRNPACTIFDALLLSFISAAILAGILFVFPLPMFPNGDYSSVERWLPIVILPIAAADIALAALAYRFNVAASVRARSVVEPWVLTIVAAGMYFVLPRGGLIVAYVASVLSAMVFSLVPMVRTFGLPRHWRPHPLELARLAWISLPLAAADMIEWGSRRLDLFLLGFFAQPAVVGIYYVAQQVATLPARLKTSFEPILGPVITRNLKDHNYQAIAKQVCQVGFWITAAQAGIALALGIPGEAVMSLIGAEFVGGTGALALLLAAEVVAATAVVSEAALIYIDRLKNLAISLAAIALQAGATVGFMLLIESRDLPPNYYGAGAAAALMLSLALSSILKARLLSRLLQARINNWRLALFWAVGPAVLVGWLVTFGPRWLELVLGVPAILLTYGFIIWRKGFGPEDRVLFKRQAPPMLEEAAEKSDEADAKGVQH